MDGRTRLVAFAFAVIVAFQLLVPLSVLVFGERPSRFGWHMYSAGVSVPEVAVVLQSGEEIEFALGDFAADVRQDVDYREHAPGLLCETVENAREVLIDQQIVLRCDG